MNAYVNELPVGIATWLLTVVELLKATKTTQYEDLIVSAAETCLIK